MQCLHGCFGSSGLSRAHLTFLARQASQPREKCKKISELHSTNLAYFELDAYEYVKCVSSAQLNNNMNVYDMKNTIELKRGAAEESKDD